jgi:succinyl-diaminopimelate desuccinylase
MEQTPETSDFDFIVNLAKRIIPVMAISPFAGGKGESDRIDEIEFILKELGYDTFTRYDVTDESQTKRSNLVLKIGNNEKTLWFIPHVDTVPAGDIHLWTKDPFKATVEGNRIYGRGSSDNLQAVFLSLYMLKKLDLSKIRYNLAIAFVADEEMGSKYGIQYLISKNIFHKDDLVIVPDWGVPDGKQIEIAEKSIMWLKFTVFGKQGHASRPSDAVNASKLGMKFMLELDEMLHERFKDTNDLFDPSASTFEITKHDLNVENINTIPGRDTFYMDCRILPKYDLDIVVDEIDRLLRKFEADNKVKITMETIQREQSPPPTSKNSEIVTLLSSAINQVSGSEPTLIGIGGGTCAAFFRNIGIEAVVWSTAVNDVYHQADEYCVVDHIFNDYKVMEKILIG